MLTLTPAAVFRPLSMTLPLGARCIWKIYRETGRVLNARLGATAMLSLWFSLLLAIGIAMS